jgi:hypothetical protein
MHIPTRSPDRITRGPNPLAGWALGLLIGIVLALSLNGCALRTNYVSGQAAADLGYVNPGDDRRVGGELGARMGGIQREMSFRDPRPPTKELRTLANGTLIETATAPTGQTHQSIAIPRGNGRWDTYRIGYRFDANWGDSNTVGVDPRPDLPPGGYIYDVVIKLDQAQTFIEGHEHG